MKTIQIVTPQNVLIEHELASVVMRGLAFLLDQIIIIVFLVFSFIFLEMLGMSSGLEDLFLYFIVVPVYFLYSLLFESFNYGQTLGKRMLGLKVRRLDGNEVTFTEAATRWLMRMPDIFISVGSLAALLITSTEKSQRLGDILAGTIVIRQVPSNSISLQNLLKINTTKDYQPVYPEVAQLNENDVVLLKQTILRAQKFRNKGHQEALDFAAEHICNLLQIEKKERKNDAFLKTVIKDYIVLTR